MSTYDAELDPSGRRRDEVGDDVGEAPDPDAHEPQEQPGPLDPSEDPYIDETAGENPS
jgi:hypothetical protein